MTVICHLANSRNISKERLCHVHLDWKPIKAFTSIDVLARQGEQATFPFVPLPTSAFLANSARMDEFAKSIDMACGHGAGLETQHLERAGLCKSKRSPCPWHSRILGIGRPHPPLAAIT